MQEKLLGQLFNELKERFSPSATRSAIRSLDVGFDVIWAELVELVDDDAYGPALRRLKTETNNLPTADRVRTILLDETKKVRAAAEKNRLDRWYKNKGGETRAELDQAPSIFTRVQQIEMASDAMALLKKIPYMTRLESIRAHQALAEKYPGSGFGHTNEEIRQILTPKEPGLPIEEAHPLAQRRYRLELEQQLAELKEWQSSNA
jgi:hypothetical protein